MTLSRFELKKTKNNNNPNNLKPIMVNSRQTVYFYMYVLTNFINKDDRGLELDGQGEDSCGQFLGLAVPFISQSGRLQVDEPETGLFGCGFGYQSFPTARGTVE